MILRIHIESYFVLSINQNPGYKCPSIGFILICYCHVWSRDCLYVSSERRVPGHLTRDNIFVALVGNGQTNDSRQYIV